MTLNSYTNSLLGNLNSRRSINTVKSGGATYLWNSQENPSAGHSIELSSRLAQSGRSRSEAVTSTTITVDRQIYVQDDDNYKVGCSFLRLGLSGEIYTALIDHGTQLDSDESSV